MNLLIELYDYPCGQDFYYIQNNEIKEFSEEIVKKLSQISVEPLIYYSFMDSCDYEKAKKEKEETISKIVDCLTGYKIEKIFIVNDGTLEGSYTVESEEE